MFSIMLVTANEREKQILTQALELKGLKVIPSKADFANFIKLAQYKPDVVVVDLPADDYGDQIHFVSLINNHENTKRIPVIAYGKVAEQALIHGFKKKGVKEYLQRPLKFTLLMKAIESVTRGTLKKVEQTPRESDIETDTRMILGSETMPREKIELLLRHVGKVMAFPFTVARVLHVTGEEKSGAKELAAIIKADPSMAVNILKVSNSVFYASANRKISSIKDAIVRIGFRETKQIVMSMMVMKLFAKKSHNVGFDRIDFWYHSLAAALISEHIARNVGTLPIAEAFLGGLLHDFGLLVLDEYYPHLLESILEKTTDKGGRFIDTETEMLGINHNDAVCELFQRWNIPSLIIRGIFDQYSVVNDGGEHIASDKKMALTIAMGDIIAKSMAVGKECDQYVNRLSNNAFQTLKLSTGISDQLQQHLLRNLELYCKFLKLKDPRYGEVQEQNARVKEKRIGIVNLAGDVFIPLFTYLMREGYNPLLVAPRVTPTMYDERFDLIVLWISTATHPKAMKPFTGFLKPCKSNSQKSNATRTDIIVAAPHPEKPPLLGEIDSERVIPQNGDLRTMEKKVLEILLRE